MITPSDKEYQDTKQIMLGKTTMNPDFRQLADFIDQTFGVRTINIVYDIIDKGTRPRLGVYFEFREEAQSFNENNGVVNFDSKKQQLIANKFKEIIHEKGINKKKGFFNSLLNRNNLYRTDNVFVYYSSFEPIALAEANESIPEKKILTLKAMLDCKGLWEISRFGSSTTFFLNTDEQVLQYKNSETRKLWAKKYFDLLEPYNEFGYFKREEFTIDFDSKENFDTNYQSNWQYYYQ